MTVNSMITFYGVVTGMLAVGLMLVLNCLRLILKTIKGLLELEKLNNDFMKNTVGGFEEVRKRLETLEKEVKDDE